MFKAGRNFFIGEVGDEGHSDCSHRYNSKICDTPVRSIMAVEGNLIAGIYAETVEDCLHFFDFFADFSI